MAEAQFEFGVAERKHFNWLAKCCSISAIALIVYLAANVAFLFNAFASGKVPVIARVLDDTLCALAVFFAAYQLIKAAESFRQVVQAQGDDFRLLSRSNRCLRLVFLSLAIMVVLLAFRFILDYPGLMHWIWAA